MKLRASEASLDSRPYWEGLCEGRFLVQRCGRCGRTRHYPRPMCNACFSMDVEWVEVCGRGTVRSWTICHHAFLPEFKAALPYVLAIADLEEGVRVNLPLAGVAHDALRIGLPVRIEIARCADSAAFPRLVADRAAV